MQARTHIRTIARADQALRGAVRAPQVALFGGSAKITSICGLNLPVFSMTPNQRSSELQGNWRHLGSKSVKGYADRPYPGEVSA